MGEVKEKQYDGTSVTVAFLDVLSFYRQCVVGIDKAD
jgi:hypothetical protein